MSTCAMLALMLFGTPVAVFLLVMLHKALRSALERIKAERIALPVGARLGPGFAVAVLAIAIAAGFGQGWRTSHPCQPASAAVIGHKLPQVLACVAR